jgi:hypothetical protein
MQSAAESANIGLCRFARSAVIPPGRRGTVRRPDFLCMHGLLYRRAARRLFGATPKAGIMAKIWRTALFVLPIFLTALPAHAQVLKKSAPPKHPTQTAPAVRLLGTAEGWSAYTYQGRSGPVCYITGFPAKREPASVKHKAAVMMVTHRPAEHVVDVVSFDEGYLFKDGSDASLEVDGTKFDLFTKGDTAWSRTSDLDKAIVAAMAKGSHAALQGTPRKGPPLDDTFSLAGFSRALAMIDKACGIGREPAK